MIVLFYCWLFLLCLVYKLSFVLGMYALEENPVYMGVGTVCSFRRPVEVLEHRPRR